MTTLFFAVAFTVLTFAQGSSQLYRMTTKQQADAVVSVLNTELKLSAEQTAQVRDIIYGSLKGQAEVMRPELSPNDVAQNNALLERQTLHIEGNLKSIVGDEKYKAYETAKPSLQAKVQAALKN